MLNYTYEVKGINLQTSFFIDHLERQTRESKYYGLSASFSPSSGGLLTVTLAHGDVAGIQKFLDWLKSASKGASKVTGVRKL